MLGVQIDAAELKGLADALGATEKQVEAARTRALKRTAATVRRMASRRLVKGLDLRAAAVIRRRLREIRKGRGLQLWFGLNDLPADAFKGRVRQTGAGVEVGRRSYPGAFIGRDSGGRQQVFKRRGSGRLPIDVETSEIKAQADEIIGAGIFAEVGAIFMRNFQQDLRARTAFGVGGR